MVVGAQAAFRAGALVSSRLSPLAEITRPKLCRLALAASCLDLPPLDPGQTPFVNVYFTVEVPPSSPVEPPASLAAARGAIRSVVRRSIERAIGPARTIAVMAGGGLDSSVVLAMTLLVARERGLRVFAVALDFEGPGDDRSYLRLVEEKHGCEIIRIRPEDCARQIVSQRGVDRAPFTFANGFFVAEMMQRAREEGAEVVLSGSGGDDYFDGDPRSLGRVARRGAPLEAVRRARAMRGFRAPRHPALAWVLRPLLASLLPRSIRVARAQRARLRRWGAPLPAWAGPAAFEFFEARRERAAARIGDALASDHTATDARDPAADTLVFYESWRLAMMVGVPRWDPFDDPELVALMRSIPSDWLMAGEVRRGLFRETFEDLLPPALVARLDKAHFHPAFARLLAAVGGLERFRHLSDVHILDSLRIVDAKKFQAAFRAFEADLAEPAAWSTLWPTMAVEAFLREEAAR